MGRPRESAIVLAAVKSKLRAARTLLGWSPAQLAKASGVSHGTIKRIGAEGGVLGGRLETAQKLVGALEEAGWNSPPGA
jgi:predicted transcriptional regulator